MKKLKYTTETKKFSELKDIIEIPKFQRGLVWNKDKKREFIKTLKAGLPIGVLLLSKKGDHYLVIDGLQRFTTMKDYAKDYFKYVDKEELSDTEIYSVILASKTASYVYNQFDETNRARIRDGVRSAIADSIRKGQNQNLLQISQSAAQAICDQVNEFDSSDANTILQAVYTIVDGFQKNADIDEIEIPLIVFLGSEDELATIFQKLNQEGVKLSKYDVFAATWINHTVVVKNDTPFIDLVINKYEAAQKDADLDIANYDPDAIRQSGELTVFEYAFAIGKAIMNSCSKLYPNKNDDSKIESIGFLLLAELMGLSYQKMGDLAKAIGEYKTLDFKALKDAIIESAKIVETALGNYILSPYKKKSLVCHSELQLASYIIVIFRLKYELSKDKGLIAKAGSSKQIKEIRQFLYKHYLYDILRGFWSGSGDSKLEEIIREPETCRYIRDVEKNSFEQVIADWLSSANKKNGQPNVSTENKLFLNYLLRENNTDVDKREYDIEHCVPKKVIQDYFIKKGKDVPISTVCNLVYIPASENRSKGDLTYYQKQAKDAITYNLNAEQLDKLSYPRKDELQFVESVATLTVENYAKFLKNREKVILKTMMDSLYN